MLPELQSQSYERDLRLIDIKEAFTEAWDAINWTEVGMRTQCKAIIASEDRLERSRRFGDEDYDEHVLNVLEGIVERDSRNELKLVEYALSKLPRPYTEASPTRDRLEKIAGYLKVIRAIGVRMTWPTTRPSRTM